MWVTTNLNLLPSLLPHSIQGVRESAGSEGSSGPSSSASSQDALQDLAGNSLRLCWSWHGEQEWGRCPGLVQAIPAKLYQLPAKSWAPLKNEFASVRAMISGMWEHQDGLPGETVSVEIIFLFKYHRVFTYYKVKYIFLREKLGKSYIYI